jgi:hypothetical protein
MSETRSASARSWRSSSAPVTRAMVTGVSVSAGLAAVRAAAAARRRRSRQAVTLVCPRPSQYSGGRPGPVAGRGRGAAGVLTRGPGHGQRGIVAGHYRRN